MNTDTALDRRLAQLREAVSTASPPPALEQALVARFRREHRATRPKLWWMPPFAMVATLVVVGWMIRAPQAPLPAAMVAVPAEARPAAPDPDATPFLALKPLERIALEPGTTVVATEFPRALLADWGLPIAPERAGEPVRAELLYSADGEALAVRLLN